MYKSEFERSLGFTYNKKIWAVAGEWINILIWFYTIRGNISVSSCIWFLHLSVVKSSVVPLTYANFTWAFFLFVILKCGLYSTLYHTSSWVVQYRGIFPVMSVSGTILLKLHGWNRIICFVQVSTSMSVAKLKGIDSPIIP